MCNAWNHPPECGCGFGPPYSFSGRVEFGPERSWIEASLSNEKEFVRGLKEAGFDPEAINRMIKPYHILRGQLRTGEKGEDQVKKLIYGWFSKKHKEIETTSMMVDLPIFKLHLPDAQGARLTYSEAEAVDKKCNWSLKVFGSGMGATRLLRIRSSSDFTVENGKCQTVYLPIPLKVTKVSYPKHGKTHSYVKIEVDPIFSSMKFNKGTKKCSKKECEEDCSKADRAVAFFPPSDVKGTHTHCLSYQGTKELTLGINPFPGISTALQASIKKENEVALQFELPPRHEYQLCTLKHAHGIVWKVR